jgi:hypothetical protein
MIRAQEISGRFVAHEIDSIMCWLGIPEVVGLIAFVAIAAGFLLIDWRMGRSSLPLRVRRLDPRVKLA